MYEDENFSEARDVYLPPKRMHPAESIFSFIRILKESILAIGIGAIAMIKQTPTIALSIIGGFLLLMLVISVLSWLRYTYRVEDGELRIEKGIFVRKKSYISINRIHKIDFTANVLHRIFKLVAMNVDTAGGGSTVSLTALKRSDAQILRKALKREKAEETSKGAGEAVVSEPRKTISFKNLVLAGATSGSAGFLIIGVFALFSQIEQFIPEATFEQALDYMIQLSVVFIVAAFILLLVGLWLLGTLGTVIKFGNFTIHKRAEELFIKRGLLETKELTIPYDRIQAIEVEQSILRKPFRLARIVAITAGGTEGLAEANPVIFPLLPAGEVERFLEEFLPDYRDTNQELNTLDRKGFKYYVFKHVILFILALIPVIYFIPSYSWLPVFFIILASLFGWMKFKEAGYLIDGKRMIVERWLYLTNYRTIFYRRRAQVYQKRQHKLQQMEKLATANIEMMGAGAAVNLRHLGDEDANMIADWFSRRK